MQHFLGRTWATPTTENFLRRNLIIDKANRDVFVVPFFIATGFVFPEITQSFDKVATVTLNVTLKNANSGSNESLLWAVYMTQ